MSEQVQSILNAARSLGREQRRELIAALAAIDMPPVEAALERKQRADALQGKYRHVPTSSESFIWRKKQEIDREPGL
jgi:hypothetical protein